MRVLLVDDDSFLRDMYATKFSQEGYDIYVARNGEEAEQLFLEDGPFDIVLLDLVMPGVNGIEFMERLAERDKLQETKVVILSNQGKQEDIDRASQAGAVGYIVKAEAIPSEVVEKVEALVNENS